MYNVNELDYINFDFVISNDKFYQVILKSLQENQGSVDNTDFASTGTAIINDKINSDLARQLIKSLKKDDESRLEIIYKYSELISMYSVELVDAVLIPTIMKNIIGEDAELYIGGGGANNSINENLWVNYSFSEYESNQVPKRLVLLDNTNSAALVVDPLNAIFKKQATTKLAGFEHGRCVILRENQLSKADIKEVNTKALQYSLVCALLGTLSGLANKMVKEAYLYSRERHAFGKFIFQHQAITYRLADLSMSRDSLSLLSQRYLLALSGKEMDIDSDALLEMIKQMSFEIAVNSLQIAGAHGYVDGLPFKKLYEQVKTINLVLNSYMVK